MVMPDSLGQKVIIKCILDRITLCVLMVQVKTMAWFARQTYFL